MSFDSIAASTIARLITLPCTSPCGRSPVRSARTMARSEPAISTPTDSAAAGSAGGPTGASGISLFGTGSPSQSAVPCAPLTRQDPFHDVSAPGLHQLPV